MTAPLHHDVLLGRGRGAFNHPGNRHFLALVEHYRIPYILTKRADRPRYSHMIIDEIKTLVPPGRFLKRGNGKSDWHEVDDRIALEKARQALSQGAPQLLSILSENEGLLNGKENCVKAGYNGTLRRYAKKWMERFSKHLQEDRAPQNNTTAEAHTAEKDEKRRAGGSSSIPIDTFKPIKAVDSEDGTLIGRSDGIYTRRCFYSTLTGPREPHDNDVLCGRGFVTNNHSGNKRYRRIVQEQRIKYMNSNRHEKPLVAQGIIDQWRRDQVPPGRFLKFNDSTGLWYDVGDKKAREKTCQMLRERFPTHRKKHKECNSIHFIRSAGLEGSPRENEFKKSKSLPFNSTVDPLVNHDPRQPIVQFETPLIDVIVEKSQTEKGNIEKRVTEIAPDVAAVVPCLNGADIWHEQESLLENGQTSTAMEVERAPPIKRETVTGEFNEQVDKTEKQKSKDYKKKRQLILTGLLTLVAAIGSASIAEHLEGEMTKGCDLSPGDGSNFSWDSYINEENVNDLADSARGASLGDIDTSDLTGIRIGPPNIFYNVEGTYPREPRRRLSLSTDGNDASAPVDVGNRCHDRGSEHFAPNCGALSQLRLGSPSQTSEGVGMSGVLKRLGDCIQTVVDDIGCDDSATEGKPKRLDGNEIFRPPQEDNHRDRTKCLDGGRYFSPAQDDNHCAGPDFAPTTKLQGQISQVGRPYFL